MSDYTEYLKQIITSLEEHAADPEHCPEFRDQCAQQIPPLQRELTDLTQPKPADRKPLTARACTPGMRWWCTPAVDLGPRICADCFNSSALGLIRCLDCAGKHADRKRHRSEWINYLKIRVHTAQECGDLADALRCDDTLETVYGMHADERRTCYTCQSWADHAHDWITGARITLDEYETARVRRGY